MRITKKQKEARETLKTIFIPIWLCMIVISVIMIPLAHSIHSALVILPIGATVFGVWVIWKIHTNC